MTVLITGGAGFIGSSFVGKCVSSGLKPIVLDKLTYAGHKANLEWLPKDSYELVVGDIADSKLVAELLKKQNVTAVFNFAAESHVDNSISGPAAFIETNIVAVYQLLQTSLEYFRGLNADAQKKFRFIQISTDEVYGSLGVEGKFSEESQYKPNSPYSASKAAGDHLARAWFKTYGLPTVVTHCTNNYGPRQYPEKLIPHMIACACAGKPLPVYGTGSNVRDWIHVDDHSDGLLLAYQKGMPGEVYGFGGNAEVKNLDLVKQLCVLLDELKPRTDKKSYAEQITFVEDRLGHDLRYAIDDSKSIKTLGYQRAYQFEQGLKATVQWYLDNQAWAATVTSKNKKAA